MSLVSPVQKDGFSYVGDSFYCEASNKSHRRATIPELKAHFNGKDTVDRPAHWYEAQLLHYGLPPSKSKGTAYKRLCDAVRAKGSLAVPANIQKMEADLKKEWNKKEREAKKALKASSGVASAPAKGTKRKAEEVSTNVSVNVSVQVSSTGAVKVSTAQPAAKKTKTGGASSSTTTTKKTTTTASKERKTTTTKVQKVDGNSKSISSPKTAKPAAKAKAPAKPAAKQPAAKAKAPTRPNAKKPAAKAKAPVKPATKQPAASGSSMNLGSGAALEPYQAGYYNGDGGDYGDDYSDNYGGGYGDSYSDGQDDGHDDGYDGDEPPPYSESDPYQVPGTQVRRSIGLLNGKYRVACPYVDDNFSERLGDLFLIATLDGGKLWLKFDFSPAVSGLMKVDRPYEPDEEGSMVFWRGHALDGASNRRFFNVDTIYRAGPVNRLRFLGGGHIRGMISLDRHEVDFDAYRLPGQLMTSEISPAQARAEWERLGQNMDTFW